jgi:hypothetical protein
MGSALHKSGQPGAFWENAAPPRWFAKPTTYGTIESGNSFSQTIAIATKVVPTKVDLTFRHVTIQPPICHKNFPQ